MTSEKRSASSSTVWIVIVWTAEKPFHPRSRTMLRRFVAAAFGLVLFAGGLLAFEAVGTIQKVEADKGILHIHANGQDRTVRLAKDVKVLGNDGKDLAGGLRAKELKE